MEDIIVAHDSVIQQQLEYHAEDIQLREGSIKAHQKTIEEYRRAKGKIREAAAQFGVFLKKFSMAPHNDATAAYMKHLIKEEKLRPSMEDRRTKRQSQHDKNEKRLTELPIELEQHKQLVVVLEQNMVEEANSQPLNEIRVDKFNQELYQLKHFGRNLRDVKQSVSTVHEAAYAERPIRVQSKRVSSRSHKASDLGSKAASIHVISRK